jgi:hypothetical protein
MTLRAIDRLSQRAVNRCLEADVQIDQRVQLALVLEAVSDANGALAIRQ